MADRSKRVHLDLNGPEFQETFFNLEATELKQVISSLRRLRTLDWDTLYSHPGLNWEAVDHIKTPTGAKAYSIRLSRKFRAIGYRDGEFLRFLSLHPDHDSAYER
ncbi:MAG TPA: hypothetical protein VGK45_01200 [Thermoanaerobaculia bacterium]